MNDAAVLVGGVHDGLTLRGTITDMFATEISVTRNGVGPVTYVSTERTDSNGERIYVPKDETSE